jgi:cytochrome c peroxidase
MSEVSQRRLAVLMLLLLAAVAVWRNDAFSLAPAFHDRRMAAQMPSDPSAAQLAALQRVYRQPSSEWPAAHYDADVVVAELAPWPGTRGPVAPSAQVALGQRLFEDPILSASGQISCQSCHHPELGWGDGLSRAIGHGRTRGLRNAPALFNAAQRDTFGWAGGVDSLAAQLRIAMTHPAEMGAQALSDITARLNADGRYRQRFNAVYGDEDITPGHLDTALIAFLSTLERPTPLDRFLAGDHTRLDAQELWGMHLFRTKARCINCHGGPLLSDQGFHNLGLSFFLQPAEDLGRYRDTGNPEDAGRFRTPSLRHVAQTAPYMHNGVFRDLRSVVMFYTQGGGETRVRNDHEAAHPLYPFVLRKDALLEPVALTREEVDALTAFLSAL